MTQYINDVPGQIEHLNRCYIAQFSRIDTLEHQLSDVVAANHLMVDRIERLEEIVTCQGKNITTLACDSHKRIVDIEVRQELEGEWRAKVGGRLKTVEDKAKDSMAVERKLSEQQTKFHRRLESIENWIGKLIKG